MFLLTRIASRVPQFLTTLLVFSLASGVLGGVLFYIDSAGPDVLDDMTEDVPIDMQVFFTTPFYNQTDMTMNDVFDIIQEQEGVETTAQVTVLDLYDYEIDDYRDRRSTLLGADPVIFDDFSKAVALSEGNQPITGNGCYIERTHFLENGLSIGNEYNVSVLTFNETYYPIRFNRTFIIQGTFRSNIFMERIGWGEDEEQFTSLKLITTRDVLVNQFEEIGFGSYNEIQDRVWVQFDRELIVENDPLVVSDTFDSIRKRIEQRTVPYAMVGSFEIQSAVYQYSSWVSAMTAITLAFTIPSLLMGIMMVRYNSKLLSDEQRRDVGTLKTRGASGWQAFSWILSNAIVTGLIGSLGAILAGALAALLSGAVRELLVFDLSLLSGFTLLLAPDAVIAVFAFSFGVGILVALPAAIRALLMTPTEAHSILEGDVLTESEKMGNPIVDLIAIAVSGYILLPLFMLLSFGGFIGIGAVLILILLPFMGVFIFFFTRLMARPTSDIKSKILARFKKPPLAVGSKVLSRNLALSKKSEALGVMFIALVFTAGIFSSLAATTGSNHMKELYQFQVGGDIVASVDPALTNVTVDLIQNITEIDGVASVSAMFETEGRIEYRQASDFGTRIVNTTITVYGVQSDTWYESAFFMDYFTQFGNPDQAMSMLAMSNSNVLSSFRPIDHYEYSATGMRTPVYHNNINMTLYDNFWNRTELECTIIDLLAIETQYMASTTYVPGIPDAREFIVMNLDHVHESMNTSRVTKFYIKTNLGANYTDVMNQVEAVAPFSFDQIESSLEYIDEVLSSRTSQTVYGAYTLNVLFTLIYLTIGMTIVGLVKSRNLRKQLSILRALGTEVNPVIQSILIDTALSIIIAVVIGGLIGLMLTSLILNMPLLYLGVTSTLYWSRLPVLIGVPIELIVGLVGFSFLFSLGATYLVIRDSLRRNIAEEIQYTE